MTTPTRFGDAAPSGRREAERLPVQFVAPEAGRLVWLIARPAASELPFDRAP